jgi:GTPase Era involved in 16S rRNA processing/gas vesicle protein
MKESNFFSWKNISEMADIDSHIVFASTLMGKYDWEKATKQNLEKQLATIVEKQSDKKLNISVIGEFSTGKSSFINALVGYELLAVNVIQGTTVAITIIEYSEDFTITLTDFSGNSSKKNYKSIDSLRQQLHVYTTDVAYARKICYVTVTLPSGILKNGYRIIDTPGTNSLELWHEDITRRAIRELSDLSIILTDATQPMPTTLVSFVDDTLSDAVKNCAFVANKIDRIREKERKGIVQFISKKICQNYDIEEPMVLPFSSVALTNSFAREIVDIDSESFLLTTNSLEQLLAYTARQRMKAQARKILHLIDDIYSTLDSNMKKIAAQYQQELQLIERSKQIDLKPFISGQITARQKDFLSGARDHKYKVESVCDSLVSKAKKSIDTKIENCATLDELSNYIKGGLSDDIKNEGLSILKGTEKHFREIRKLFNKELKRFQKDFEKEFEKLKILSVKFNVKPKDVAIRHSAHSANIGPVTTLIKEELSKENWAFGGGAAAGAAIGTAIAPGVGTIFGAVIGFFAGAAAAPDRSEVKRKIKSKLSTPLRSYYRSIASDCMTNYNNYLDDVSMYLELEINRYYSTYDSTVKQRIKEWNSQHRKAKERIQKIENEIDGIKNRQHSIKSIISKL